MLFCLFVYKDNPLFNNAAAGGAQEQPPPAQAPMDGLLALEQAKVDMTGMNPMPIKKTLIIVNAFISESVSFLNRFVGTCEKKLLDVDSRIERMKLRIFFYFIFFSSLLNLKFLPNVSSE